MGYRLILQEEDFLMLKHFKIPVDNFFKEDSDGAYSYFFGVERVSNYSHFVKISKNLLFYMSPFSGLEYGCKGGYGNQILKNRCLFKKIKSKIDKSNFELLLSSVNPASRLTGIEYYYRNKNKFNKDEQKEINIKIDKVFKELGEKYAFLYHDVYYWNNPRNAVEKQLQKKCD